MTRRGVLLFSALGVAWGIPYVLIKIAVGEISPAMLVLLRTGLATLLLLPLAAARGQLWPVLRRWWPLAAYTLAEIVLPWLALSDAERSLPSSTSGLLLAAVPLAGVGVAFLMGRREHLSPANWAGLAVGIAGVAALVGLDVSGSDLGAVAELSITVVGYALGPAILARWMSDLPGIGIVSASLALAMLVYLPIVAFTDAWPTAWPSGSVIASVVVLAVVCSAAAFLLMVALVSEIGPVRATAITYVNPAVAIIAGAVLLGEQITAWTVVGFVLVIAGSYLVTKRPLTVAEAAVEPVAACESH